MAVAQGVSSARPPEVSRFMLLGAVVAVLLPGALTVWLSFSGGGYFVGSVGLAAVLLILGLVLRIGLAHRPFAGFGLMSVVAAAALALLAVWALVSAVWSEAPARALVDYQRILLYLLALVLFGSLPRSTDRVRRTMNALAAAIAVVSIAALASRALPDVISTAPNLAGDRLSYPLSYWNALGILVAFGILFCFHLSASVREPVHARVLGSAALPIMGPTLLLTFSRGAIAAAIGGLVAYLLLSRPRGIVSGLVAAAPAALAVVAAYGADLLATDDPTSAAAVAQGHELAWIVAACVGGAVLLRVLTLPLDARAARLSLPTESRRLVIAGACGLAAATALVVALALGVPERVSHQYDRFVEGGTVSSSDVRGRLTDPGNNSRLDHWEVAIDVYREQPVTGAGAGTYSLEWAQRRSSDLAVNEGHSLYVEVLGELGIVGLLLVSAAVLAILAGLASRIRGPDRSVYAAVAAATLAWAVHAGIDWDWEMPAVTLWVFALGGLAIARAPAASSPGRRAGRLHGVPPSLARVVMSLGLLILAVAPVLLVRSQATLDDSVTAFKRGDCRAAIDSALASNSALPVRPEPFEVLAYCDARLGRGALAVRAMESAVRRDPRSWELHYGLALVRGAAGLDPRSAAREAQRLNPRHPLVRDAVRAFRTPDPRERERRARRARLPFPFF